MADKKMYKVGITVKEPWSADISYEVLDITLYAVENGGDGCSYIAIRANQGVTPGTDDTVWVKATQRGQSIYDLAVKYGDFEGTEAEFEAEYEAAVHAAQSAAQSASEIEAQVETNEAARVTAERARSDAETARSSAEAARINAENARDDAESLRDTAESDRVRAEAGRVTAEASRVEAETFRQGAEQSRRQQFEGLKADMETAIDNVDAKSAEIAEDIEGYEANEAARVSAEQSRVSAESSRVSAESARATAETARQTAEGNRATAETERASAEGARTTAEQGRVSAEQGRVSAESGRVSAESGRVAAETARESASATAVQNAETATADANTAAEHAEEAAATIDDKIAGKADQSEVSQLSQEVREKQGGECLAPMTLEQGAIVSSTGADTASTTRIRTQGYIYADVVNIVTSGSKVYIMGYKEDGTFVESEGWKTENTTVQFAGAVKYRFVFAKSNNEPLSPSEYDSLGVSVSVTSFGKFGAKEDVTKLKQNTALLQPISLNITPDIFTNIHTYVNAYGVLASNMAYGNTNALPVSAGQRLKMSGVGSDIPFFVFCDQDGVLISAGQKSKGIGDTVDFTFSENGYIRLNGRIKEDGNGLVSGLIWSGLTMPEIERKGNILAKQVQRYVSTRGAVYTRDPETKFVTVRLNTLFVYKFASSAVTTINDSNDYLLSNANRFFVLAGDGTIKQRINSTHLQADDFILLYYDDNSANKDIVAGALYADYIKSRIRDVSEISMLPENLGQVNCVRKAKQMAMFKWTPKLANTIPYNNGTFPATEQEGLIYSSVKEYNQFVFEDVSLETFMTAVNNSRSVLYTEKVSASGSQSAIGRTYHGVNCAAYYGSVCSGLLTFAYGLPKNVTTYEFRTWDRMEIIEDQSAYGCKIGDAVWTSGHIQLITGITKNKYGIITEIELVENAASTTRVKTWTTAQMDAYLVDNDALILRYKDLYANRNYTPLTDFVAVDGETIGSYTYNNDICPNYGDKSNYNEGDAVVLNIRTDYADAGFTTLEVYKDNALLLSRAIAGQDETLTGLSYGDYKARITGTGVESAYAQFKVVNADVNKNGGSFSFSSQNATPVYYEFCDLQGRRSYDIVGLSTHTFTEAELQSGSATPAGEIVSTGNYHYLKVHFQTDYGRVTKVIDWSL